MAFFHFAKSNHKPQIFQFFHSILRHGTMHTAHKTISICTKIQRKKILTLSLLKLTTIRDNKKSEIF